MEYLHSCIKCSAQYKDIDPEPYYCKECLEEKKRIAKEVDEKMKGRISKKGHSLIQEYDNSPKVGGFMITKL